MKFYYFFSTNFAFAIYRINKMINLVRIALKVSKRNPNLRFCSSSSVLPQLFNNEGRVKELDNNMDYFCMFGVDKSFTVEVPELAKTFKNLQRQLHPDKVRIPEVFKSVTKPHTLK